MTRRSLLAACLGAPVAVLSGGLRPVHAFAGLRNRWMSFGRGAVYVLHGRESVAMRPRPEDGCYHQLGICQGRFFQDERRADVACRHLDAPGGVQ